MMYLSGMELVKRSSQAVFYHLLLCLSFLTNLIGKDTFRKSIANGFCLVLNECPKSINSAYFRGLGIYCRNHNA